jgi:hypothetical protein
MKRKGAEGLPAVKRLTPAANEEFSEVPSGLDSHTYAQSGWDPYEVWRTRVKASSRVPPERERDPLR